MELTDALGAAIGFWDPLGATDLDFWGLGEEGTIGYLRHAEIKHGEFAYTAAAPARAPRQAKIRLDSWRSGKIPIQV